MIKPMQFGSSLMKCSAMGVTIALSFPLPGRAQPTQTFTYRCEGGKTFQAEYLPESVRIHLSDRPALTLPQLPSGSGIRYGNDTITLRGKGNEAYIEENNQITYNNCVTQDQPAAATSPPVRALW